MNRLPCLPGRSSTALLLSALSLALTSFAGTSTPPGLVASAPCPLECDAQPNIFIVDPDWFVSWSSVTDGTAEDETCTTCTKCNGTVGWIYVGNKRWLITTSGGITGGQGPNYGAFLAASSCDDPMPQGASGEQGNPLTPGFIAQLYCLCDT